MFSFSFPEIVQFRKKSKKKIRQRILKMEVMCQHKNQKNKFKKYCY